MHLLNGTIIKCNNITVTLPIDSASIQMYNTINSNDRLPNINLEQYIGKEIYMYNIKAGEITEFIIEDGQIYCTFKPTMIFTRYSILSISRIAMEIDISKLSGYVKNIDIDFRIIHMI